MEQEEIKNSIIERFNNLQPEIQEAIMNTNYENILVEIGEKYKLSPEQIGEFEFNTTLVLLGQTHPDEYSKELSENLKLPEETIKEIVNEINEKVLKNIRALLVKNFEEEKMVFDPNFSGLPQNIQEAIANSNWKEKLYEISGKYKLTISQMGILEEITTKVIKNEIRSDQYENELASKITILREDISNLVKDVNEEILKKIRELMREQNGKITTNAELLPNNDSEIPLPPYAKAEEKKEIPKSYKKIEEEKIPEPLNKIITNDQLLINNEIENPAPIKLAQEINMPKNILEEKLKGATSSNHSISNYSVPKINTENPSVVNNNENPLPRSFDPYRETF